MTLHEAGLRAAALAYQGLFSLFPLLLFFIFVGSQVLTSIDVREQLDSFLLRAIPTADGFDFLQRIIDQTIDLRGSLGLIGILGLLWTSSALFTNLSSSLNVIWGSPHRSVWRRRLLAVAAGLILGAPLLLAVVLSAPRAWVTHRRPNQKSTPPPPPPTPRSRPRSSGCSPFRNGSAGSALSTIASRKRVPRMSTAATASSRRRQTDRCGEPQITFRLEDRLVKRAEEVHSSPRIPIRPSEPRRSMV